MREKLNENPLAQVALVAVLLVAAGFMLLSSMGGGGESESESGAEAGSEASASTVSTTAAAEEPLAPAASVAPAAPSTIDAPPPPRAVMSAWDSGRTVVLLFVRPGGIDDRMVAADTVRVAAMPGVSLFVVPAARIARYASITEGVGVDRVPALLVLRPKRLARGTPTASVTYGYLGPQSVVQAVVDAGYKGRTLSYHP
jgi:hypothetical protein